MHRSGGGVASKILCGCDGGEGEAIALVFFFTFGVLNVGLGLGQVDKRERKGLAQQFHCVRCTV